MVVVTQNRNHHRLPVAALVVGIAVVDTAAALVVGIAVVDIVAASAVDIVAVGIAAVLVVGIAADIGFDLAVPYLVESKVVTQSRNHHL